MTQLKKNVVFSLPHSLDIDEKFYFSFSVNSPFSIFFFLKHGSLFFSYTRESTDSYQNMSVTSGGYKNNQYHRTNQIQILDSLIIFNVILRVCLCCKKSLFHYRDCCYVSCTMVSETVSVRVYVCVCVCVCVCVYVCMCTLHIILTV